MDHKDDLEASRPATAGSVLHATDIAALILCELHPQKRLEMLRIYTQTGKEGIEKTEQADDPVYHYVIFLSSLRTVRNC